MPKIFLDTNIIIDVIGNRQPFSLPAANVLNLACTGEAELYATALTFANALYVLRKSLGTADATQCLKQLSEIVRIASTTQAEVEQAFNSQNPDFEDALQYFAAVAVKADAIITRNPKHFKYAKIPVMDAEQCLKLLDSLH